MLLMSPTSLIEIDRHDYYLVGSINNSCAETSFSIGSDCSAEVGNAFGAFLNKSFKYVCFKSLFKGFGSMRKDIPQNCQQNSTN